jgi:hypothetical protein
MVGPPSPASCIVVAFVARYVSDVCRRWSLACHLQRRAGLQEQLSATETASTSSTSTSTFSSKSSTSTST